MTHVAAFFLPATWISPIFKFAQLDRRLYPDTEAAEEAAWIRPRSLLPLTDALQLLLEQLVHDHTLLEPNQLRRRLEALDRVDALLLPAETVGADLDRRVREICSQLEAANHHLYADIRAQIQCGKLDSLLGWVHSLSHSDDKTAANGMGYDLLDELIAGVLPLDEPDGEQLPLAPETVFYQPTPARHIFRLIEQAELRSNDVFIDVGCGLGHVPLLVSLFTPARSVGLDFEPAYIKRAQECAQQLNLENVQFIHQDALAADLSSGTVFYLYTPFTGSVLSAAVKRLKHEATNRPIRIFTYGPCTADFARESWLHTVAPPREDHITLFSSRA